MHSRWILFFVFSFLLALPTAAPQATITSVAASAPTSVPPLVPYAGVASSSDGKPLTGSAAVTFQIYKEETGGEALWTETQTVTIDLTGHFKVQLGATSPNGLPADLFTTGEARWLEVQITGQTPQSRVLLASVPYALKAGDATTLNGLPASAYALAATKSAPALAVPAGVTPDANATVTTPGGTTGYLPVFTGAATVADSILFSTSTGIGVGDVPNSTAVFDVNGKSIWRGLLNVSRQGTATAATGYDSYAMFFQASSYNSSTKAAALPAFQLQAEPTGNDTAAPAGTFNLLYNANGGTPTETGLSFNGNGTINFASGQTFPGTGAGTITGVTAGTGLTGGGTSGVVTLKVDPTKVAELGASNSFAATQTIASGNLNLSAGNLNLPATTSANSGVITIGGVPFLHGYTAATYNVFVGGAGNFTTTGQDNVGVGPYSLINQTSGNNNTAVGVSSLKFDTAGSENTAIGAVALYSNTTGSDSTAVGLAALTSNTTGSENTAVGNDALLLNTTGSANTAVGGYALDSNTTGGDNTAVGDLALVENTTGFNNTANGSSALYSNTLGSGNTAVGGNALTANTTGINSTAVGWAAMQSETTGGSSAALGYEALGSDTTGCCNTAVGVQALNNNTTGSFLTAVGYDATSSSSAVVNNATALGANSIVGQSNSLILGQTTDGKPGASFVNVGIGTATPRTTLEVAVNAPNALGPVLTLTNSGTGGSAIDFNTSQPAADSIYTPSARIVAYNSAGSNQIAFQSRSGEGMQKNLVVSDDGSVYVPGTAGLRINHPLDPGNKYLVHSSVESSEMMNIYSGNVTTDELGLATVTLPNWFEAENTDFRYQLTVIGQFAQAIVRDKIANGQFRIMTNASHVEVSWQITAVRQDAYAKAHPLEVEQLKPAGERAGASHPEFGQPASAVDRTFDHPAPPEPKMPETAVPAPRMHPAVARPALHIASAAK